MGTWNHRVVRRVHPDCDPEENTEYAIYEVYYDEHGKPDACTASAIAPVSFEGLESLRWTLEMMLKSLDKPVLEYDRSNWAADNAGPRAAEASIEDAETGGGRSFTEAEWLKYVEKLEAEDDGGT